MNNSGVDNQPQVGIYWVVNSAKGNAQLITAMTSLNEAEIYGEFLVYSLGHYEIWEHWRLKSNPDSITRQIARSYEYEDWPRGRVLYDQSTSCFTLYADKKLIQPVYIKMLLTRFHLPAEKTNVESDFHYQSNYHLE